MKTHPYLVRAARLAFTSAVIAGAVITSGCAKKPDGSVDIVATAQNVALTGCGFVPKVETVLSIVNVNDPALQTGVAIGNAICQAVILPAGAPKGVAAPMVAGVKVDGRFVR